MTAGGERRSYDRSRTGGSPEVLVREAGVANAGVRSGWAKRGAKGGLVAVAMMTALAVPRVGSGQEAPAQPPKLDRLLKLPDGVAFDVDRRGGATRSEWKARFADARKEVETARKEYEGAMAKLEKAAAGSETWRFVPPGGDVAAENQDNLRLRMDVTKKREDLATAERRQRDLDVEANLASVPDDWR